MVCGVVVDFVWCVDLFDVVCVYYDDLVVEFYCFGLVVCDVDGCYVECV